MTRVAVPYVIPRPSLVVTGPPASGKTRLARFLATAAGDDAILSTASALRAELQSSQRRQELVNTLLLIVDDFEPDIHLRSLALLQVLAERAGRLPTIILSTSSPSDWAAAAPSRAARRAITGFLSCAHSIELLVDRRGMA